ncbi:hypothetical protein PMIN06_012262 [Paraphaeosphaeria minitans]
MARTMPAAAAIIAGRAPKKPAFQKGSRAAADPKDVEAAKARTERRARGVKEVSREWAE